MKKVYAGLPLWGWLGIGGGGLLVLLVVRRRNAAASSPSAVQTPSSYAPPTGLYQLAPIYLGANPDAAATPSNTPTPAAVPSRLTPWSGTLGSTAGGSYLGAGAHPLPFTTHPGGWPGGWQSGLSLSPSNISFSPVPYQPLGA